MRLRAKLPRLPGKFNLSVRRACVRSWFPGLLRQRSFRHYCGSASVSLLGDGVSAVALPLTAVVYLHADAAQMGYLTSVVWLPVLLFSVLAGALADRLGRHRSLMIAADLARAALVTSVPACAALGLLSLPLLYVLVFTVGLLTTAFAVAEIAVFADIVGKEHYVEGQSIIYGSQSLASTAGASLGGVLAAVLSAPAALGADAASYLGSALLLAGISGPERPQPARQPGGSTAAGLRYIARSPLMRAALSVTSIVNFFNMMFTALLVLYLSRDLHLSSALIGVVLASAAVGAVLGALVPRPLASAIGLGTILLAGSLLVSVPLIPVPFAAGPTPAVTALLLIAVTCSGAGRSTLDITVGSVFAATVPGDMRARVKGAYQTVSLGARPLGALAGGAAGTLLGLRWALLAAALGGTLTWVGMVRSPLLSYRITDSPQTPRNPAGP